MDVKTHDLIRKTAFAMWREQTDGKRSFQRGDTYIPPSGKVIQQTELEFVMLALAQGVLTAGHWARTFEAGLESFLGIRHAKFVNSGSSANLLAISAMLDPMSAYRDRPPLNVGARIVTAALGFPTTVNPILQAGMTAVLVDVEPGTYVPTAEAIQWAIEEFGARGVMMAHTLGAPWPADEIDLTKVAVVEDNCDALGSKIGDRFTGTFGDASTLSFYPAHHITTGEGGAVMTDLGRIARVIESLRDWGRSCWCEPGKENTCGKRFGWEFPALPPGTDHKYIYERVGYNLKGTDLQAAIGVAQLRGIDNFIAHRRLNWSRLRVMLSDFDDVFILPEEPPGTTPSWFGFALTLRPGPFSREDLCRWLEGRRIGTRPLFAGFLKDQPAFTDHPRVMAQGHFPNAQEAGRAGFWVGVWPGLGTEEIDWIAESLQEAGECARKGAGLPAGAT